MNKVNVRKMLKLSGCFVAFILLSIVVGYILFQIPFMSYSKMEQGYWLIYFLNGAIWLFTMELPKITKRTEFAFLAFTSSFAICIYTVFTNYGYYLSLNTNIFTFTLSPFRTLAHAFTNWPLFVQILLTVYVCVLILLAFILEDN